MNYWRKDPAPATRKAIAWMVERNIKNSSVADALGITQTAVSHFLAGRSTSAGIRAYFIDTLGCPERIMIGIDKLRENRRRKGKKA